MATLSITIPDAVLSRVVTGMSSQLGYQEFITNGDGVPIPNPETRTNFCKRMIRIYVKDAVKAWEASQAAEAARAAAAQNVEQGVIIT